MKKEPAAKIYCLYHKMENCVCIKPVQTQAELEKRIKNRDILWKRFGIKV